MEQVRARAEARLFGTESQPRIGRYEISNVIGGGGMGVVYGAYDPQLQRKVALKVLHPRRNRDPRSQQRMLIEARALAKLDHPNVVKIHDALVENEQVVVVMELLEGETLDRWQMTATPTWQEIATVYAQAGEGLHAAHGVGVVHRDFKPSNAIIGSDGRVRVVDFGLARLTETQADHPPTPGGATDVGLTGTGDVIGTLAYASPEQLDGATVTAASDQFSFCVSLHAAIEGVAPFTGGNYQERRASIGRGQPLLATDGRRVPSWLRALIARGLAASPADRFPSLRDIVRELRRPRGWRRWRFPVLALMVLAGATASAATLSRQADEPCDGGVRMLARTWSVDVRERIQRSLDAIATPYAHEVRDDVIRKLDRYGVEWQSAHRNACLAHRRGETSAVLLDRQMSCLSRRLSDMHAGIEAIATVDARGVGQVMDVATGIPNVGPCMDSELMQSDVPPPDTLELRVRIANLRAQISAAEALARAGHSERALSILHRTRALASATPYVPVQVEVALAEGRILLAQDDLRAAIAALTKAREAAFEQQMLPAAVEASARLIFAEGALDPRLEKLKGEIDTLLPLSAGLRGDHFARPLLLNNIGTAYLAAGERQRAAAYFELAKSEVRRNDPENVELTNIDVNLVMVTSDGPKREALARGVWEKLRDTVGEQHHFTLDALYAYAVYVSDPALAFDAMSRALDSYQRFHPTARRQIVFGASKRAFLAAELGDLRRSNQLYARAIELMADADDDDTIQLRHLCKGEHALQSGDPKSAVTELSAVYDARRNSRNWWERADALRAEVGLGQAFAMLGNDNDASRHLEAAVRDYPEILDKNEEVEHRRYLARARRALALVLRRSTADRERATSLEQDARTFYMSAGQASYKWILSTLP